MLFDLQGKRRRVVQVVYLTLAVLMGGGYLLFNVGGNFAGGGLFDAFTSNQTEGGGNELVEKRLKRAQERLRVNPTDEPALKTTVRDRYQLAAAQASEQGDFGAKAKAELRKADAAWKRYLALPPRSVDDSLAGLMLQAYGEAGLNKPAEAARAAEIVAEARPSPNAYLQLTRYAALAGQSRKAKLAGDKAVELAPGNQRKDARAQVALLLRGGEAPGPSR